MTQSILTPALVYGLKAQFAQMYPDYKISYRCVELDDAMRYTHMRIIFTAQSILDNVPVLDIHDVIGRVSRETYIDMQLRLSECMNRACRLDTEDYHI